MTTEDDIRSDTEPDMRMKGTLCTLEAAEPAISCESYKFV